jgi:bifunctional enzyme CysN/CysC
MGDLRRTGSSYPMDIANESPEPAVMNHMLSPASIGVPHDFRDTDRGDGGATAVKSANLTAVQSRVSPTDRAARIGHRGGVLWLTGLSGSGKSTIALELERRLFDAGYNVYVLDGDNIRHGLSSNLGFSPEDRTENIRRIGEVAALFADAGCIVITAFISPYRADRDIARKATGDNFHEIHIKAELSVCESRDPKGLYAKARRSEIPEFTGISAPYEAPLDPECIVDTAVADLEGSVTLLSDYVASKFCQWMA